MKGKMYTKVEIRMNKRKILITASTFPRYEGDTEPSFILDLAKALTDYFDVTVIAPMDPKSKKRENIEGVHIERYHYFPIYKWETLCYPGAIVPRVREKKIRGLLIPFLFIGLYLKVLRSAPQYDFVIANWIMPQGIVQSFVNKRYLLVGLGGDVTSLNTGLIKKLKIRALKRARAVIMVSSNLKEIANELLGEVPISIIPMGVDSVRFNPGKRVEGLFGEKKEKVILFVGRLAEKKGAKYLIEAMNMIDEAHLVIVGGGPEEKALRSQAQKTGKKISFLGAKSHLELVELYASADIFVAPSIVAKDGDQEGVPVAIIEAMASGMPIVTCNTGGITDVVEHMKNGIVCEQKDCDSLARAINLLLNNEELRENMGKCARLTAERMDYSVIAKRYAEIINREVENGKTPNYSDSTGV